MHYFILISHELSLKNKLDEAAKNFLMQHNRTIIDEKNLKSFVSEINKEIEKLNAQYSRCKPLEPNWWSPGFGNMVGKDWILSRVGSCSFILYLTKN